jgi:hypothetical protein
MGRRKLEVGFQTSEHVRFVGTSQIFLLWCLGHLGLNLIESEAPIE